MSGSISISNLRNIRSLEFDIPPQGTWLLTAGNGGGKTSLLACLRRIGSSNAFPTHFPSSVESESLDNFSEGRIVYTVDGESVEHAYRGERWAPRPRVNSHLLRQFGYPSVVYMGASAERLTPRPEDFLLRRVRPAPPTLISALNDIFETDRFAELKRINLAPGVGNEVFLLRTSTDPLRYHSEKHFSLGELCVLKLVEGIRECPNQSLVLIDELELALHPRAQIKLFRYLETIAARKRLTVIFSTHSVTLLKSVPRRSIIYLERLPDGTVRPLKGCFPTYALGNITLGEERAPDVVLYVEDEVARWIVEPLVKRVLQDRFREVALFPDVRTVPIGAFNAVVQFLSNHRALLPPNTRAFALLDDDVRTETVTNWRLNDCHEQLASFDRLRDQIAYLPWTPEVGILNYIRRDHGAAERELRSAFTTPAIWIDNALLAGAAGLAGAELRREAKRIVWSLVGTIAQAAGISEDHAMQGVCRQFAINEFAHRRAEMLALFLPKLT